MAFFLKLKLNCLLKMHGYPQFSFWIPKVLTKIYFLRIVLNRAKISVKNRFDINKHTLRVAGRKSRVNEGLV